MGAGKTQSAITLMNEDSSDTAYIYITPYLKEVERIKESCKSKHFTSPENRGSGKLDSLHVLLAERRNIVSTHALFSAYTPVTAELIRSGGYTLILDEVFCVVEPVEMYRSDLNMLFNDEKMTMDEDGEHIKWLDDEYTGKFQDVKRRAQSHTLILYKKCLLFWTFPMEIFESFSKVLILTYMFKSQVQKYYFDMNHVDIEYIGVRNVSGIYRFCSFYDGIFKINKLSDKIKIVDNPRLNMIGESDFSLSSSWYKRESKRTGKPWIKVLHNNLYNYFNNLTDSNSSRSMWTTFKEYRGALQGKGYTKGFVSCNIRATNEYREKISAAYCINVYMVPLFKQYFVDHGCDVDEDGYALSEMVQWIWRSAIRDGKEINAYVPSKRMRLLLMDWIDAVS